MGLKQVGQPVDDAFARHRRKARPTAIIECGARRGHGTIDIGGRCIDNVRHNSAVRRIFHRDHRTVGRINPLVVDEQLRFARQRLGCGRGIGGLHVTDGGDVVHRSSSFGNGLRQRAADYFVGKAYKLHTGLQPQNRRAARLGCGGASHRDLTGHGGWQARITMRITPPSIAPKEID
jgi:hypothetical protein